MTKKLLSLAFCAAMLLGASVSSRAADDPDPQGTVTISAYVGPKFMFGVNMSGSGTGARVHLGIGGYATGDYVLVDSWWIGHFCIGATVGGYTFPHAKLSDGFETRSNFVIAPRVTYGINLGSGFEVHAGVNLGPAIHHDQVTYENGDKKYSHPNSLIFDFGPLAGARWYFTSKLALCAEINFLESVPTFGIGAAFKF